MARRAAVAVGVLLFALAGCGGSDPGPQSASAGEIVELTGVDELRSAFVADDGTHRLVLLLSPT
jgi:hypothetical protein